MNKFYSFALAAFIYAAGSTAPAKAQHPDNSLPVEVQASRITTELAKLLQLNEHQMVHIRKFNLDKLRRIKDLAKLREQDRRYLELRLDLIEEHYHSLMFNNLSEQQYLGFMDYKALQPADLPGPLPQLAEQY